MQIAAQNAQNSTRTETSILFCHQLCRVDESTRLQNKECEIFDRNEGLHLVGEAHVKQERTASILIILVGTREERDLCLLLDAADTKLHQGIRHRRL